MINEWLTDTDQSVTWAEIAHDNDAQLKVGLTEEVLTQLRAQMLVRMEENEKAIKAWTKERQKAEADKKDTEHTKDFDRQMANGQAVLQRAWKVTPTPEILARVSPTQNISRSASFGWFALSLTVWWPTCSHFWCFARFCCFLIAFSINVQCPEALKTNVDKPTVEDFLNPDSVYCGKRKGRSGFLSTKRRRFNNALNFLFPIHPAIVEGNETKPDPKASHYWYNLKFPGHPAIGNLGGFKMSELPLPFINRAQLDLAQKVSLRTQIASKQGYKQRSLMSTIAHFCHL